MKKWLNVRRTLKNENKVIGGNSTSRRSHPSFHAGEWQKVTYVEPPASTHINAGDMAEKSTKKSTDYKRQERESADYKQRSHAGGMAEERCGKVDGL